MPRAVYVSDDGMTQCPACQAHIRVHSSLEQTRCPFCDAALTTTPRVTQARGKRGRWMAAALFGVVTIAAPGGPAEGRMLPDRGQESVELPAATDNALRSIPARKPTPQPKYGHPPDTRPGKINKNVVYKVIKRHLPKLERCARDAKAHGKFRVGLKIAPSGRAQGVFVKGPGAEDGEAKRCMKKVLKRARFPKHSSKPISIIFPIRVAAPSVETPPVEAPPVETPPVETPPVEAPPVETPPVETPPVEAPPVETPPVETPPVETPPVETSPVETPPVETPPVETSPVETPPVETPPVEAPPVETPPVEAPPVETPPVEAPPAEALPVDGERELNLPPEGGPPSPKLGRREVQETIKQHMAQFKACSAHAKEDSTIRVAWKVQADGSTSDVRLRSPEHADTELGRCLKSTIERMRFPQNDGEAPKIIYPFRINAE